MRTFNSYEDEIRAEAYSRLEFPGTYYLAYRDLPKIISKYKKGKKALDFGCGTGRSTRFLDENGFDVIGVDISGDMIKKARELDPGGDYRLIDDGKFDEFERYSFDLILSVFTFDNIPKMGKKVHIFKELRRLLKPGGFIVNLVSSPEIYTHEWASFSTKDFPENKNARTGDIVRVIITDVEDKRPVEDIFMSKDAYPNVYKQAGLNIIDIHRTLGKMNEPYLWVSETDISPWVIYVISP